MYNGHFKNKSPSVHMLSAVSARLVKTTCTIPLCIQDQDAVENGTNIICHTSYKSYVAQVDISHVDRVRGFYTGITSSCTGSLETAIYIILYEKLKKQAAKAINFTLRTAFALLRCAGSYVVLHLVSAWGGTDTITSHLSRPAKIPLLIPNAI